MSRYKIEFIPSALRQFKKFSPSVRTQVQHAIDGLAEDPVHMAIKSFMENLKNFIVLIPEIIVSFMKFTIRF